MIIIIRECLIKEESEEYCVFNEDDRKELVFKTFLHTVFGGSMCQYEDYITEYLDATKQLYKMLVR